VACSFYRSVGDEPENYQTGKLDGWEHSGPYEIAEFTREFDETTKLIIKSDREPVYLRVGGRRTNSAKHNITFGKLKLSGYDFPRPTYANDRH